VLAGWVLVAPCVFWAMSQPELGQEEYHVAWALQSGENAEQVDFMSPAIMQKPVAHYLEEEVFPDGESVAMDAFQGYSIAVQVSPEDFRERLFLTADRRFEYIVEDPTRYGVSYLLVPKPEEVPQDAIVRERPGLWAGETPGFELVESFPDTMNEWRLYKAVPSNTGEPGRNDERPNDRAG
jgi:hypothetical protein